MTVAAAGRVHARPLGSVGAVGAGAVMLLACAGSDPPRVRRRHPSGAAVHAAFEAVGARAERCLGAGDRVTVEGFFEGTRGEFFVERVGTASSATRVAVQQCVAGVMEEARVRPFGGLRHDATWTVAGREVSAAVRAMLTRDAEAPTAAVMGAVDARAVMATLQAEGGEMRRCYEDALRGARRLRGSVELRFTLSVDGRITHAVASGPPGFRPVGHCIFGRLRTLAWPAARGAAVDFVVPMSFAPRNEALRDY